MEDDTEYLAVQGIMKNRNRADKQESLKKNKKRVFRERNTVNLFSRNRRITGGYSRGSFTEIYKLNDFTRNLMNKK